MFRYWKKNYTVLMNDYRSLQTRYYDLGVKCQELTTQNKNQQRLIKQMQQKLDDIILALKVMQNVVDPQFSKKA